MTTFANVLPVQQLASHKYSVQLEDAWCIGTGDEIVYVSQDIC